jgi:serine/threonine-protein kinase RsbW
MTAMPNQTADITFKIRGEAKYISPLSVALHSLCLHVTGQEACALDMQRAVVEALNNVVLHAYKNQLGHDITVCWYQEDRHIRIEIMDSGISMTALPEPILPAYDAESGRGWWIINACVDEYHYKVIEHVQRERQLKLGQPPEPAEITHIQSHTNILTLIKQF